MFLKYFEFLFRPFRSINNQNLSVKNIKGNIQVDINRPKSLKGRGQDVVQRAQGSNQKFA